MTPQFSYTWEVTKLSRHLSEPDRQKYVNRVYRFIREMDPGEKGHLGDLCKPENQPLFVEIIKMYIDEQRWPDVEFTEDYQTVRKMN